ncbi:SEC-C motif domain protein [Anaeromyxobacter dehalogenans 2CP-1]|uniref:SEC-C motif domain protein n=1 Tax=Anaeromyxobacter dehalogenans (strain ATCC BAA-258 / DSM 21875 / 2CP-1) TaxID=455488 RepID=B8J8Q6_ANAD2|nr:SEC-C metal-binding domain-containing protein [Anaeromyxobacter dehalogenans]ACL67342.1 SEC-C motif domain protein [Anaeromyxobacter dehalogenans 2CP-1]
MTELEALLAELERCAGPDDPRAVQVLSRMLDRLLRAPIADCALCAWQDLARIAGAIRASGGTVTAEQQAGIDAAFEEGAKLLVPFDPSAVPSPASLPARVARALRPGRNDPCRCGSGRKYKRCHLAEDERAAH